MMHVEDMRNEEIGERLVRVKLDSGLEIQVVPRPGYTKTYATFATHYGSIDNHFIEPETRAKLHVPDGIAHFLEHKMFEKLDGGDVFNDFARLGASSNAYTDYTSTTFLFATTSHLRENLDILLEFVQRPFFTEENVEKEKGIIEQEIRMYLDMPGDRLHSNLMKAMYFNHPVRIDIAGSVESIRTITPDTLYQCYKTFYHPSNMIVVVIGDVDPQEIIDQIAHYEKQKNFKPQGPIQRIFPEEPSEVKQKRITQKMPVSTPLFVMGYKSEPTGLRGEALLLEEIRLGLMWTLLLGRGSSLYQDLYQSGLISDRFHARYSGSSTFGFNAISGETPDPERLEEVLTARLPEAAFNEEDLIRAKKREIGDIIGLYQHPEDLAYAMNSFYFRGVNLFHYLDLVDKVTISDLERLRREQLEESRRTVSIIYPDTK